MKKSIIFDMDGVILDSEPLHCQAWRETYREIGIEITPEYYFAKICGQHGKVSTSIVLNEFNINADPEELIEKKERLFCEKVKNSNTAPFPSVVKLIEKLRKFNYPLGLASSTSFIGVDAILNKVGVKEHFSAIHAGEAVDRGKPHPDIYLKTAKMLHAEPEDCIVIEDSPSGVLSAKKAGMKVIGLLNGRNNREQLEFADRIVENFSEITIDLIENL